MAFTELGIRTQKRIEFIDITPKVKQFISEHAINEGFCLMYCPHTTAAITINEGADPDVVSDIINALNKLVPEHNNYRHAEGNSDAHIKSSLLGCYEYLPIRNGRLLLGTWQAVFFCEFDGPRSRKVIVQALKLE